jgi:hypothetical protein
MKYGAVLAFCVVAGCGTARDDPSALGQLFARLAPQQEAAPTPDPALLRASLTPAVMAQIGVPVMIAQVPSRGAVALLSRVNSNRGVDTFLSADGISISTRNGMIVATRGFGFDLMRADTARALEGIARAPATVARAFDHLNGENQIVSVTYQCRYAANAERQVTESCASAAQAFENTHRLGDQGGIVQSKQWVSAQIGVIILEIIQ